MVIKVNIKKQLRYLYSHYAVASFRITDVVWVLFLLNRGYSLVEVGIAEGIFHLTSMICEVPSGMAADLFGRKKTLALSGIAGIISSFFMGYGERLGFIYLGMVFSAIGISMLSGTEEAMLYDSLVEALEEAGYKKEKVNLSIVSRLCSTASCLFSPIAIYLGYRKVYFLSAFLNVIQVGIALKMKEPIVTERQKKRQENPLVQIGSRLKLHVCDTFAFMRSHPKTLCKLLADAAIACPCYLTLMYLQEHLVECGWPEAWIGIPMLVIPMAGMIGAWIASKVDIKLLHAALICGVIGGLGTAFAGNEIFIIAIAGAVVGRLAEGFFEILAGENINKELNSDQRATMISVDSMLYSVLMIVASPVTGWLGESFGMKMMSQVFGTGIVIATIGFVYIYLRIKNKKENQN